MPVVAYSVAASAVVAALLLRWSLDPWFGDTVPYLQFFPAIAAASWFGGFGPGLLATALSAIAADYYFLAPSGFGIASVPDMVSFAFFLAIGLVIAGLNDRLRDVQESLRDQVLGAANRAERLSAIINTTVDGIIVINAHGVIESFNPGAQRLFGYAEGEVLGRNVSMLMPQPFRDEHDHYLERYQKTGNPAIIGKGREVRGKRRDGSEFPLHLSVGEMRVAGERKFTGMLHDLTERVRLEEKLRASEARWRSVIDSAIDAVIVIDAKGSIESFNPAAVRLFGYGEAEVVGRNVNILMPSPYHEEHDGYLARYNATGLARIIGSGREVTGRRKDGSTFPLHLSVGESNVNGERRFTGILHDLTARVGLEAQLRERTALAKLGEMAAVLAHEIKNPLAGIRGALEIVGGRLPAGNPDAPIVKEIIARVDSLDAMMKELLLFARPPQPQRSPTDIVPLIQTTVALLKRDHDAVHVDVEIGGSAPPVLADPAMLTMVIQNLLLNGVHAMAGHGRIRVGVGNVDDRWCRIAIADDGPGIPAEIRDKIFTPFFTTKRRGTGLGLPTSKRFVEAHNGRIDIECPPTGGTTVTIELPSDAAARQEA